MADDAAPQPLARWYMAAAVAALLFMLLGCLVFWLDSTADPASLPLDQRAAMQARPFWLVMMNGIAVVAGAIGGLLLILRRRAAESFLLLSMIAVAIWLIGLLAIGPLRDSLSTNDIAVAVAVTLVTWTIYGFARHSRQRGWLR
jgi:hypothetical protein